MQWANAWDSQGLGQHGQPLDLLWRNHDLAGRHLSLHARCAHSLARCYLGQRVGVDVVFPCKAVLQWYFELANPAAQLGSAAASLAAVFIWGLLLRHDHAAGRRVQ